MYISYDHYRIFYYVAKYGNITQAARVLLNNQPNLTRAIKTLEAELGCQLFLRNNRGVRLTPEGERLFSHVQSAFESIEAGEAELRQSRDMESGVVSVAASEVALHCALLPVLKRYRALHPGVRLKISNHSTPQAIDALQNGLADIAVVTTPTIPSPMLAEQSIQPFREVAVCSLAFPALLKGPVSFETLLRQPLIGLGPHTKSFDLYSDFFARQGLRYHPETEAATADQILPMVKADLGVGFVPEAFLPGAEGVGIIQTPPLPQREIRLLKRKTHPLSIAARELERLMGHSDASMTKKYQSEELEKMVEITNAL